MSRPLSVALFCCVLLAMATGPASAAIITCNSASISHRLDGPYTIGMLFQVGPSPITISHLGVQDDGSSGPNSDGFVGGSVNVGLWNADGTTLLGSVQVASSDLLLDTYRYHALTGYITLQANTQYLIGAAVGVGREWWEDNYPSGTATFAGNGVSIIQNRVNVGGTLAAPLLDGTSTLGRWGPANATFIPEPSTLAMLLGGGIGLWLFVWRRWRS